jgi:hypothetical protein
MKTQLFRSIAATLVALAAIVSVAPAATEAARSPRAMLFLNGETVRTFVVPAPLPHGGSDPLFMVTNGATGQLGIAGIGPGEPGYNGGAWAVYTVTFDDGVTPYLLTSDEDVEEAEAAGDVTVTRRPDLDNRCPIQQ